MVFTSTIFLFAFLPFTYIVYMLLPAIWLKNTFLFIMSLLFYAYGEPVFVYAMLGSICLNYISALLIHFSKHKGFKKLWLILSVTANLSLLFVYKYLGFITTNLNRVGIAVPMVEIVLPIGISFFTFQAMSYTLDVYRGTAEMQRNPLNVGLYVALFPQLIAGPIVRYQTIADQVKYRQHALDDFSEGVRRFIIGFAKKVLLANTMALVADQAFSVHPSTLSPSFAWVGIIAYSFQILFDFSGYSEMAIGLGKMFGFHFLENFDYPYIAASVSEFWRRWHMSLGQWFRDYVYFPLGGSRVSSKGRLVFNLFVVWFLTGVWHGASWNFIAWGLFYFVLLAFEKLSGYPKRFQSKHAMRLYRLFTLLCVVGGWVLFRSPSMRWALSYSQAMFGAYGNAFISNETIRAINAHWPIFIACAICSTPVFGLIKDRLPDGSPWQLLANSISVLFYCFVMFWSVSTLITSGHNPFIYFQF